MVVVIVAVVAATARGYETVTRRYSPDEDRAIVVVVIVAVVAATARGYETITRRYSPDEHSCVVS